MAVKDFLDYEAEEYYRKAIGIYTRLAIGNPKAFFPIINSLCNNLAGLPNQTN